MGTNPNLKAVPSAGPKSMFMNARQAEAVDIMRLLGMPMVQAEEFSKYSLEIEPNSTFMYQNAGRSKNPNMYIRVLLGSIIIGKVVDGGNKFDEYLELSSKKTDPQSDLDTIVFPTTITQNIYSVKAGAKGALVVSLPASNFLESAKKMPTLIPDCIKSQEKMFEKLMVHRSTKIGMTVESAALYEIGYMLARSISDAIRDKNAKHMVWLFRRLHDTMRDFHEMISENKALGNELEFHHKLLASIFARIK